MTEVPLYLRTNRAVRSAEGEHAVGAGDVRVRSSGQDAPQGWRARLLATCLPGNLADEETPSPGTLQ